MNSLGTPVTGEEGRWVAGSVVSVILDTDQKNAFVQNAKYADVVHGHAISDINGLIDWFGTGSAIPNGSDLNTYTTNGKYYCGSSAGSKTMLNCPVTNDNFVLFVFRRTSGNSLAQMIITLGGELHIRGSSSDGSYRTWQSYTSRATVEALIAAITAEDVGALALTAIRRAFAQVDTSGDVNSTTVTAYPTEPGVYKVTTALTELPTGCSRYGTLMIFNGGGYVVHVYVDNSKRFYVARTTGGTEYAVAAPTSDAWYQLYTTGNKPTAEDVGASKIESGSYVGTGTYGKDNPNSLTFGFVPKMVIVVQDSTTSLSGSSGYSKIWMGQDGDTSFGYYTLSGTTLSWYAAYNSYGPQHQCNASGETYYWVACGERRNDT